MTLALESVVEPVSLYEPVYNDGGDTLFVCDPVGESGGEESWISFYQFKDTVNALSRGEKNHVLALFVWKNYTSRGGKRNRYQSSAGQTDSKRMPLIELKSSYKKKERCAMQRPFKIYTRNVLP